MKKRFEQNSDKQRELFNISQKWFNYWEMNEIENSLSLNYQNKINKEIEMVDRQIDVLREGIITLENSTVSTNISDEEVKTAKQDDLNKISNALMSELRQVYLKMYTLFIVDFTNKWEKYIKMIFDLCDINVGKGRNVQYIKDIEPLIKEHFKILYSSEIYQDIKKIIIIANKIKHDLSSDASIINKYLENLLDIEINMSENQECHIRELPNPDNLEHTEKKHFESLVNKLDKDKKDIKESKKLNISYILNNFNSTINSSWIFKEFSFDMQENILVTHGGKSASFIIFSEEEKRSIQNNPKKYIKNY